MPDLEGVDLRGTRFEHVDLTGSKWRDVDLSDARFHGVDLSRVVIRGALLLNVDVSGELENVVINGVDVAPLVEAELDRRSPLRAKMRPTDSPGYLEAWVILERLWEETVERARRLPPELLDESVDGEWSFIETLRHLVFATDSWISRAVLGEPAPWDPLGLPYDEMPATPGVPRDRDARPSLDVVLELRRDRMSTMRRVLESLTDESLDDHTVPVQAPGFPEPVSYAVTRCLLCILNEEWEHRLFAERDLEFLESRDG